jgi:hypothetical protein
MEAGMKSIARILVLVLAFASGWAAAADVGRVVLAAGEATALRAGQPVRLALGTVIQDKDVLRTGAASNLQVRFEDDSYVSLRENSELRVDEFRFTKGAGKDSAVFSLLKGGLRAVTGAVGRRNNDDYKMVTPTATIGIRGTDYAATLCQGDCRNADGSQARDGVYGRVIGQSQGTNQVVVQNESGPATLLGINSNFFVSDRSSPVERLLVSPDFVLSKLESRQRGGSKGQAGGTGSEKASTGGATEESRPSTTPAPLPQLQFVVTQDLGPQGTPSVLLAAPNGFVVAFPGKGGLFGDAGFDDDHLIGTFNSQNQLLSFTDGSITASLAGGSIVDAGSYAYGNQTFVWGRWTGATSVPLFNGSTDVQTTGVPLLFGTANGIEKDGSDVVGKMGGVATYSYVGGPRPVDGSGNVGNITSTSTTINFTTLSQALSLNMSFPSILVGSSNTGSATFSLSGTGSQSFSSGGEFSGNLSGSCSGGGCASPSASGFFGTGLTGPNGYELAPVAGIVHGTQGGEVAFLNLYQVSNFTPGASPAPPLSGQTAHSDPTYGPSRTFGIGSGPNASFSSTAPYYPQNFSNPTPCSTGNCFLSATLGAGTVVGQGSTSLPDGGQMHWGRWSGGQITDRVSGTPTAYTPAGGVAFAVGTPLGALPAGGSFVYSFAGGPAVSNNAGAIGSTLSQGAFNITFGPNLTMSVNTPLQFNIAASNFSLNSLALVNGTPCSGGVCTIANGFGQNMNFNATCSGACTSVSSAIASSFFVGAQGSGMAVAGNVMSNAPGGTATFAGAFKRP